MVSIGGLAHPITHENKCLIFLINSFFSDQFNSFLLLKERQTQPSNSKCKGHEKT